jgi:hypothetical protein
MPRVALITEERVIQELSSFPKHNKNTAGFCLKSQTVCWTNGAVAVRWNRTQNSHNLLAGQEVFEMDFDKLLPQEDEPTSSVGLDVYMTYKILKIVGAQRGFIYHVGSNYIVRVEPAWEIDGQSVVQEVDVVVAGIVHDPGH